jgi:hypothetical protein
MCDATCAGTALPAVHRNFKWRLVGLCEGRRGQSMPVRKALNGPGAGGRGVASPRCGRHPDWGPQLARPRSPGGARVVRQVGQCRLSTTGLLRTAMRASAAISWNALVNPRRGARKQKRQVMGEGCSCKTTTSTGWPTRSPHLRPLDSTRWSARAHSFGTCCSWHDLTLKVVPGKKLASFCSGT